MYIDLYTCCSYAVVLVALLVALASLRPHAGVFKRCVIVSLAFFGLLLIFLHRSYDAWVCHCCSSLLYRGDVLVLLMGRYLLKKSWREVFLALGVYTLVAWLMSFLDAWRACEQYEVGMQVMAAFSGYLSALFNGLIVWLFARAYGHSYGRCLLLSAAALQCGWLAKYIWGVIYMGFRLCDIFDGNPLVVLVIAHGVLDYLIPFAIYMLMQFVIFRLSWKRSALCTFTLLLPGLLCALFFFWYEMP